MCVTWLIYVCDMTHSCVWHDSFMCVTWLIHVCYMTHLCVWHDSLMCVTWLINVCDRTRGTHMNESCHTHEWVMSHTWMSHVTHMNEAHTWMSHTWMSHVTHMKESHTWMSHVTHMNESCHTHEGVMSHICMRHGTRERVLAQDSAVNSFPIKLMNKSHTWIHQTHEYVTRMKDSGDTQRTHVQCFTEFVSHLYSKSCHMHKRDTRMNESHTWISQTHE